MGVHKEFIANVRKFESDFRGGQHGCECVSMGDQQYALHSQIVSVPPQKPGCTLAYPINPTHGNISVADQKYQNNLHNYHMVKNMNSALNKIVEAAIDNQ